MRIDFKNRDGTVTTIEAAHSATLSYRTGGTPDTIDQGDLHVVYLHDIEAIEVSGHAEAPKAEKPFPTEQKEMSTAEFFLGPVNMKYATGKAQEEKVILTMRKPTNGQA